MCVDNKTFINIVDTRKTLRCIVAVGGDDDDDDVHGAIFIHVLMISIFCISQLELGIITFIGYFVFVTIFYLNFKGSHSLSSSFMEVCLP